MLDQRLPGVGALGTSSCADSLAPPHTWEAAQSTHRRVSVGYVGRKTRKGPLARKPLASCPLSPPDGPGLGWPCCGPCGAAELLSARGVEHSPALYGGRQRGRTSAAFQDLPSATRPPPTPGQAGLRPGGPGACCSTRPAAGPTARTSSSAFSQPLWLSVPCLACPPEVTEIARAWELCVPPSCSPGPGTRCGDTVSPSKKTEARRAAVGRPWGINGRPQNNRSYCEDRWRSAGLIPACLCLQRWGRRPQRTGQTAFLPRGTHFPVRENRP